MFSPTFFISHAPSIGFYSAFLFSYCFALLPLGFHIPQFSVQTLGFDLNSYCPPDDQLHHELTLTELSRPHKSFGQVPQAHCQLIQNPLFPLSPTAVFMVSDLPDSFGRRAGPVFFQRDSSLKPAKLIYHHLPWDLILTYSLGLISHSYRVKSKGSFSEPKGEVTVFCKSLLSKIC